MKIGQRIRTLREINNKSADDIAATLRISNDEYYSYEQGSADIPISILHRIAAMFRMEVSELLENQQPESAALTIIRAEDGVLIEEQNDFRTFALAHTYLNRKIEPKIIAIEPALDMPNKKAHSGQEFNFILSGTIEFIHGSQKHTLHSGDSVYFDASITHARRAIGNVSAVVLSVSSL